MTTERVDVIATTVSGSIHDWKKIERIQPLFSKFGLKNVILHVVESHGEARARTQEVIRSGGRIPISAGGSGTFKNVLEGIIDSGVALAEIRLGFLRKGSADLIGKVLNMPDDIEAAARVFAESIRSNSTLPCDVLRAESMAGDIQPQHFVGYGGVELFGRIPHFTENRFMKWYKGILGQLFGDLGPFTTGMILALGERFLKAPFGKRVTWNIRVDGADIPPDRYHALIVVNGYLGPELPFSPDPLGSGRFHLFALRDLGLWQLLHQARLTRSGAIMKDPLRWGLKHFTAQQMLELTPSSSDAFPANVDGSTLECRQALRISRVDRIRLISNQAEGNLTT
ncbi:MAG: diacylglycerol kinase family protein [bacterium]